MRRNPRFYGSAAVPRLIDGFGSQDGLVVVVSRRCYGSASDFLVARLLLAGEDYEDDVHRAFSIAVPALA